MNITGFFRQDDQIKAEWFIVLKNLPVKKPHIHSYVTEHFLNCTSNTGLTATSPDSSCTRCHRSRSGCDSLLQNEHTRSCVLAEGREEPGGQNHVPAWAAQPGRLSRDTQLPASNSMSQKVYSKSESSLQQPYWLKWEWKDLDTSRDSGLSIGTAFFYSSCLWYFLSLNNLSCLSKTDAA